MSDAATEKLIVILGSGPGIGVGVASHFAFQSFGRVALVSRNAERLKEDAETVKANSGKKDLQVKVYAVDVGNVLALEKTLGQVAHDLGPPEVVVYNAVRLRQSKFGDVSAKELTEDFQVCFHLSQYMVAAISVSGPILRLHTLGRHLWSLYHGDVGDATPVSSRCKRPKRCSSVIPGHRRWFVQEPNAAILRAGDDEGSAGQFGRESSEGI
jgi:NAD(P)-dependent dehydrogenase (short-subunit alcohol dehydrogenase family)